MLDRIERQSSLVFGGGVTQPIGDQPVTGFVKGNAKQGRSDKHHGLPDTVELQLTEPLRK